MAVSIDEHIRLLREAQESLLANTGVITLKAGAQLLADNRLRVQEHGQNAEGGNYKGYSTKKIPAFLHFNKALNSKARDEVSRKSRAKEGMSYKDLREAGGLQTDHKDFTYTGRMWNNIRVTLSPQGTGVFRAIIAGANEDTKKLIGFNSERDGEILSSSIAEIAEADLTVEQELTQLLKRAGI